MARSAIGFLAALLSVTAGCYRPDVGRCAVTCLDGVTCPDGTTCGADLRCHAHGEADDCPSATGFVTIAAGAGHACAIDADGALWCWGDDRAGQLGADVGGGRTGTPTQVSPTGWTAVAAGAHHTCGVRDGEMLCWGVGEYGEVGDPALGTAHDTPWPLPGGATDWFAVAAGDTHSCGIRGDRGHGGRLYCWGDDSHHQLGDPGDDASGAAPREVGTTDGVDRFDDFVEVEASYEHTCARRAGGEAYCFGWNAWGQLGTDDQTDRDVPTAVGGGPFASLSVGFVTSCGLAASDGSVWCWGDNQVGELGQPPAELALSAVPIQVGSDGGWSAVVAGQHGTCGTRAGQVWCWGAGDRGEIGDGGWRERDEPTAVPALANIVALAAGDRFVCALTDGEAYCWGDDDHGQLGNGSWATKWEPTRVGTAADWELVVTGSDHTCGIRAGGHLWCWGADDVQQLGADVVADSPAPVEVTAADGWETVDLGAQHTCAIRTGSATRELWCWGNDSSGQIGVSSGGADTYAPVEVLHQAAGWDLLASSLYGNCATSGGARYCWGDNTGQVLGDGGQFAVPTQVASESIAWDQLSFGYDFGFGIAGTDLYYWGSNAVGQLGLGNTTAGPFALPQPPAVGAWTEVGAAYGGTTACVVTGGALECWGDNSYGVLGSDTPADHGETPTPVVGGASTWLHVSVGNSHACAIGDTDQLWCWGKNVDGELGDESIFYQAGAPRRIDAARAWASVSAGGDHTCAITTSHELYCWGLNVRGVIGDGSRSWPTPQRAVH